MTDLATVIKSIESAGNPKAIRFEPDAYAKWNWVPAMDRIKTAHRCSNDTAKMLACTSFGLYQILGVNIYDPRLADIQTPPGYPRIDPGDVFSFVADAVLQDMTFAAFLKLHAISYTLEELLADDGKMSAFVTKYNGPRNVPEYSARIRSAATSEVTP